ncbi:MAG: ZIP family metal transporter [Elusimicrobia bacterium]|nr:ZIP family metal transporter [Elusimicrobiota bacterium]
MTVWLCAVGSLVFVSLLSLIGVLTLALNENRVRGLLLYLVSFAVGALYGDAFIHIIPESFRAPGSGAAPSFWILGGVFFFFVVEKSIRWSEGTVRAPGARLEPYVAIMLSVDAVHNFIDGLVIGASYLAGLPIGLATTLAVAFHEIPHELGDFAVLVHGGCSLRRALLFNFLSALTAVLGGVISLALGAGHAGYVDVVLPATAGGFIYIAGSALIPELHKEIRWKVSAGQFLCMAAGAGLMALLALWAR